MPRRSIEIEGERWDVYPSGRVTVYADDEHGLVFEKGTGSGRVLRVTRFSPRGVKRTDAALMELPEARLRELFRFSQSARTSPDLGYRRRSS
jgi:hypothetical protein